MTDPLDTAAVTDLLARARAGNPAAWDELVRAFAGQFEAMARRMLRRHPAVRRWEETADLVQNALVRLLRTLQTVTPGSTRELVGLAAGHLRRELLDLARHYQGPHGHGRRYAGPVGEGGAAPEPASPEEADLDRWAALHEAVGRLPAEDREVFMLSFYHGWTQPQIAGLFGVDERTVRRRWRAAGLRLSEMLGGDLPAGGG